VVRAPVVRVAVPAIPAGAHGRVRFRGRVRF
jgi:hypothetical protein